MSIIDERGRLLGRVNVVDAAVLTIVAVLIPAAYAGYLLFRDPAPILTSVAPWLQPVGPNQQVEVYGEHFRPYMRVSFNDYQGKNFLFVNPKTAVVPLPDLPPGKYDVVLYDYMREVARLPHALTVEAPPPRPVVPVELSGFLAEVNAETKRDLRPGSTFATYGRMTAQVTALDAPVPATLHVRTDDHAGATVSVPAESVLPVRVATTCQVEPSADGTMRCAIGTVVLAPDAAVSVPALGPLASLRIEQIHFPGSSRQATVRVRFIMSGEVRAKLKAGDRDLSGSTKIAGRMATLVSMRDAGDVAAALLRDDRLRQSIPTNRLVAVDAVLSVPVDQTKLGWSYKGAAVKAGAPFSFETADYVVSGGVTDIVVVGEGQGERP